tara:strand:- start:3083 stop:3790 length:708 start_codon:yes stop_codon:yes gene_type:complete
MQKIKLSIIIPCYNEVKNIPIIINKFNTIINRDDIELILVDNGSTDSTNELLKKIIHKYSFLRTVTIKTNKGYGYGITYGFKIAKGEFLSYTHADMQTDPSDVLKGLKIIERQNDSCNCYVKGNRKGRPLFDQCFTIGMSIFETIYLREKLLDINAQPNIFHKDYFNKLSNIPKDFSIDLYLLYMAKKIGLRVIRFNVSFPERIHGQSKWNTSLLAKYKFIIRTISFSYNMKKYI